MTGKQTIQHKKKQFLELLEKNTLHIGNTCKALNVERGWYYRNIDKDPEFREQCESVKESFIDTVESYLFKNIQKGDTTSIIFFLKTRAKHRGYIEKEQIEINKLPQGFEINEI